VKRIPTGLALAGGALLIVKLAPFWLIWAVLGLITVLAVEELRRILERLGRPPWPVVTHLGALATLFTFLLPDPPVALVLVFVVVAAFVRALAPTQGPAEGIDRVVGTLLPVLYIGLTLGHIGGLFTPGQPAPARARSEDLLVLALCAVYVGDTFALCGGLTLGRHKLAPGVSPAKTWEGAVAGLFGAVGAALLAHFWFFRALSLGHAVTVGLILGGAAILGDLAESLLKRAANLKDSGALFPGHGGMLDRVDSLLLAGPALYWYHRLLLAGG
jgi:phosphatidate cytidylyltransferase